MYSLARPSAAVPAVYQASALLAPAMAAVYYFSIDVRISVDKPLIAFNFFMTSGVPCSIAINLSLSSLPFVNTPGAHACALDSNFALC